MRSTRLTRRSLGQRAARVGAMAGSVFALAACGGAGGRAAPGTPGNEPVTIRWSTWGNENNPMVEGAAKGIDLFREQFPHVTVKAEPQVSTPGGPSWTDKNLAEWLAGDGPDVSGACCATLTDWGR